MIHPTSIRIEPIYCLHAKRLSADWYAKDRADPYERIWLITHGTGYLNYPDKQVHLRPGLQCLVPSGVRIDFGKPDELGMYWFHFTATDPAGRPLTERFSTINVMDETPGFAALAEATVNTIHSDPIGTHGRLCLMLAEFLSDAQPAREPDLRFEPVFAYIQHNLAKQIRLRDLAALVHLELTYFSHLFKNHTGLSPSQYIIRRRVHAAQMHLAESDLPLSEIALQTGFYDAYHLSRTFKKQLGLTPSTYRKMNPRKT
tara:strand:- start:51 stop:824 length:774 start_codon:yes stop_codon:yes gene_type:complete